MHTTIQSPLSRKATLVTLNISVYTARRLDRKITDETNKRHNAVSDAGRYNKLLIPTEHLKRITAAVSALRATHYEMTMPWKDEGPRVLPNALYNKYTATMQELIREFNEAADEFERIYPKLVAEAPKRLNGMFDAKDYPAARDIRGKFSVSFDVTTLPDAADFRCDIDPEIEADIRAEIEATQKRTEGALQASTIARVTEVVSHMAEKLAEYKTGKVKKDGRTGRKFFTDSLVGNVRDLADLLPAFNLNNDPKLAAITDRIQRELCVEEAKELRDNDDAREVVQKSAESILEDVSKFLA